MRMDVRLTRAVQAALSMAAITILTTPAQAQQQTSSSEVTSEEIVVTGSRIRRLDRETASPVQTVAREEIERTGLQNVGDVIRGVVMADNQGSIPTAFTGGFAAGSSAISLRGLGVNSTLVLVNGRRMAQYGLADDGVRTFVDLNSIPLDAVERVEVLKDGGSAIYGSDAVAGVVNVILRDKYEGFEFGGDVGATGEGDGDSVRLHGIGGFSGERSNAFLSLEASRDQAINHTERGGYLGTSDLRRFGFFDNRRGAYQAGLGNFADHSGPAFNASTPYGTVRVPGATQSDRINLLPCPEVSPETGVCLFDNVAYNEIQPKVERFNALGRATLELNESTEGYVELGYFTTHVWSVGTPGGVNDSGVFDPADPASPMVHTTILPAGHPDNPTGVNRTLSLLTTMLGGRNAEQKSEVFRGVAEISGKLGTWDWGVGGAYIKSELTDINYGFIRHPVLQAALNNGSFRIDPSLNSPELLAQISPVLRRQPESSVALGDVRLGGSLFDLPGGPFGVAFGAEYRKEKADTPPVPFTDVAEIVGLGFSSFEAERTVYAGYVEANAPVTSWLELNGAFRYDHYDDYGSSTTPKLGVKVKPISQLALRATYSESFRAPGPAESGNSSSFGFTNIGILTVGNSELDPEEATSYTLGLVYEPVAGTSISVDYYNIERDKEIIGADQTTVIGDLPSIGEPNSRIPGLLPGSFLFYDINGDLGTISAPFINANKTNTDGLDFDVRYRMNLGALGSLTASLVWSHVFSFEREIPGGDKLEYVGTHGPYVLSSASGTPSDRSRFELAWGLGEMQVSAAVNYVSSLDNIDHKGETLSDQEDGTYATTTFEGAYFVADPSGKVCGVYNPDGTVRNGCELDEFITVDLFASYSGIANTVLRASITNVLDKTAPFDPYTYGGLNYNPTFHQAGALGRVFNVGMTYKF